MAERHFPPAFLVTRVRQDEDNLAVEHVDADVAPANHFTNVPGAGFFGIQRGGDPLTGGDLRPSRFVKDTLLARRFAAIRNPRFFLQDDLPAFDVNIGSVHAPPLADSLLHDVALDRAHPGIAARALRPDAPIKQAAVAIMFRLGARRPLLFAPLVFDPDVDVAELRLGCDGAEDLPGHTDGRPAVLLHHREDTQRVVVESQGRLRRSLWIQVTAALRTQPFVPIGKVFLIEQRLPFSRCVRGRRSPTRQQQTNSGGKQ